MYDLDLRLEVIWGHVNHCVTFAIEYLGHRYRDRRLVKGPPIGDGLWEIQWSRDRWRQVALKGQTRDLNTLKDQYLENGWR